MSLPDQIYTAVRRLPTSSDVVARDIPLASIAIPDGRRAARPKAVARLVESIREVGLLSPVTVRPVLDGKVVSYILVAGRHRLEAFQRLAAEYPDEYGPIPAFVLFTDDEVEHRLREIAENLHRAELTALERSEQIAEWVSLTGAKVAQVGPPIGGHQPKEEGVRKAAEELSVARSNVQRAVQIANISDEAKEAAREAGLDDNQSALLKVAAAPAEQQVAVVHQIVEAKALKTKQDVQNRAAIAAAELVVSAMTSGAIEHLRANLQATTLKAFLAAINNLVGESVMDREVFSMTTFGICMAAWMLINVGIVIGFFLAALFRANGDLSSDHEVQR